MYSGDVALLDAPTAALLASALRANRTLQRLTLSGVRLWDDVPAGLAVLNALVGHPSLRDIDLSHNHVKNATDAVIVGSVFGTLVAVDTPALEDLDVCACSLTDDGLRPLCDALPRNTHLRSLRVDGNHTSDDAFWTQQLFPAVRANTSLRALWYGEPEGDPVNGFLHNESMMEVVRFVEERDAARLAAEADGAAADGA